MKQIIDFRKAILFKSSSLKKYLMKTIIYKFLLLFICFGSFSADIFARGDSISYYRGKNEALGSGSNIQIRATSGKYIYINVGGAYSFSYKGRGPDTTVVCYLNGIGQLIDSPHLITVTGSDGCTFTFIHVVNQSMLEIDLSYAPFITKLELSGNRLTGLNVSNNIYLRELDCGANYGITTLDLSNNAELRVLDCSYNRLTALNVNSCPELESLYCGSNQLTSLNAAICHKLKTLNCNVNR